MADASHDFGGDWTEVKLDTIEAYSKFFTQAIGGKFDLWYVDPFAGTGARTATETSGGLFQNEPISQAEVQYPGSAARALSVSPCFHHFRFGDAKRRHVQALQSLVAKHPEKDAEVLRGDANQFIQEMFSKAPWTAPDCGPVRSRALVFLDPYGLEVQWSTLRVLARCKKADVWFLANHKAALQQLAHDHSKLDDDKRKALSEYFGGADWESRFYDVRSDESDLLGMMTNRSRRKANKQEVAAFHRECLLNLFAYVSPPLALSVGTMDDYFHLYCLSNNPTKAAQNLIHKGASWVIKRYTQASHRRSARRGGDQ